jgi:hypothetical protein
MDEFVNLRTDIYARAIDLSYPSRRGSLFLYDGGSKKPHALARGASLESRGDGAAETGQDILAVKLIVQT